MLRHLLDHLTCLRSLLMLGMVFCMLGDSRAQEDSTALYRKIHDYSQKHGVTRWIYQTIFAEPETGKKPPAPKTPSRRVNPVERHRGKIVRSIQVIVTDPFGYTVDDTATAAACTLDLLQQRDIWHQMGQHAHTHVQQHYLLPMMIRDYLEALGSVVARKFA